MREDELEKLEKKFHYAKMDLIQIINKYDFDFYDSCSFLGANAAIILTNPEDAEELMLGLLCLSGSFTETLKGILKAEPMRFTENKGD